MEINSVASQMQIQQAAKARTNSDPSNFAALLQGTINSDASVKPDTSSQPLTDQSQQSVRDRLRDSSQGTGEKKDALHEAFSDFVGQTFFAELIKSCRSTQQPAAYFNGGRAEKIFQGQMDQIMAEDLSDRSADKIADPMYEQFMLRRRG